MPGSSSRSLPIMRDAVEVGRAVADQHRALERRAELAAVDLVGLRHLEHVLARGDVDLAAAEAHRVDAVLHRGDDLLRVAVAGQHVGVGHARHRHVAVALPPAVAGRLHAHEAGVLPVLHVAGEDAVLDQHGAAGRRALVVDRQRTPPRRNGAVVDHGDALGGDLLAHQARERRRLLAVEVAFEPVTHRLVQHHARPAGAEHHVHLAGRRRHRREIGQRLAERDVGGVLPGVRLEEPLEALAAAGAVAAGFLPVAVAGDDRDVDPHQRADVAVALAVGAQDFDHLPARAERHRHLPHPRVLRPQIGVDGLQEPHLGLERRRAERILVAVEPPVGVGRGVGIAAGIAALDGAHRVGRPRQRRLRHVGGMRIADRLVLDGAQPETLVGVVGRLLEPAVVEHQHLGLGVFEIKLAVVGAFEAADEVAAHVVAVEAGAVDERFGGRGHGRVPVVGLAAKIGCSAAGREGLRLWADTLPVILRCPPKAGLEGCAATMWREPGRRPSRLGAIPRRRRALTRLRRLAPQGNGETLRQAVHAPVHGRREVWRTWMISTTSPATL